MTAAVENFMQWQGRSGPHLAFSFNFTDLPVGRDLIRMQSAFSNVERFCVYSQYERELYPKVFNLPQDRFHPVKWAQSPPLISLLEPIPESPFVVAIGGEGRDYEGMIAAARVRPDIRWIVIARPSESFDNVPSNMSVMFNVPAPLTWGIAARSASVIVPLLTPQTCCGHITIASTQLLGLPLLTTRSLATEEYVGMTPGTTVVEPGDPEALALAAANAIEDRMAQRERAIAAQEMVKERYDLSLWANYISRFIRDYYPGSLT
jgi:hypothetical protein